MPFQINKVALFSVTRHAEQERERLPRRAALARDDARGRAEAHISEHKLRYLLIETALD